MTNWFSRLQFSRRLKDAITTASRSADRYSNRMYWLNIILLVLTVVQAVAAWPTIKVLLHL